MCRHYVFIAVVFGVATLAYVLYVPLPPEDFKQPIRVSLELAGLKLVDITGQVADNLGFQYATVSRAMTSLVLAVMSSDVDTSVVYSDTDFAGVPVRVYQPKGKEQNSRAVVFIHGGGFALGDIASYHSLVHRIAKDLNVVAISVGYRKAPEHLFPAAIEDCESVVKHFLQHAAEFGVDPHRVAIMGDSAGGNLALVTTLRLLRANFSPLPKLQVLIYPWLQMLDFEMPSFHYEEAPLVTKHRAVDFISWYLYGSHQYKEELLSNSHVSIEFRNSIRHIMDTNLLPNDEFKENYRATVYTESKIWDDIKDQFKNPDLSPLLADDKELAKLPVTYVSSCQYDILRDEQILFVKRLQKAGVKVNHEHLRACYHGWILTHDTSFNDEFQQLLVEVNRYL